MHFPPPALRWEGVLLALVLAVLPTGPDLLQAQPLSSIQAAFVDPGIGARQAALGHAGSVLSGVEGGFANPASAARLPRLDIAFGYMDHLGMVPAGRAHLGLRAGRHWGIGVGATESGDEVLTETAVELVLARTVGRLDLGISGRVLLATFGRNTLDPSAYTVFDPDEIATGISQQVQGDATGMALSAGVRYASGRAALGIAVRNPFSSITWNSGTAAGVGRSYKEGLPLEVLAGAVIPAGPRGLMVMDIRPALDSELDHIVRVGGEWAPVSVLALRLGTERRFNGRDDDRFTAGFALTTPASSQVRILASYAYVADFLGASQQVGLRIVLP